MELPQFSHSRKTQNPCFEEIQHCTVMEDLAPPYPTIKLKYKGFHNHLILLNALIKSATSTLGSALHALQIQ